MHTQVLIVGAGPTGLMLANQLGRRGIPVIIVDRHSGPAQQSRAMAVHARTLEIYAYLGIAERSLELGRRGNAANMWTDGKRTARIPLGDIGRDLSPFPYVLMLGQDDNERIMGEKLHAWDIAVQWNTELVALKQLPASVEAVLKQPDGTTRAVRAAYVAGCDGAHSAVRELSGIGFPGAPYEHVFFVADTEATGSMVPEELNVFLWRDGFHLFFPMRGHNRWRAIGILPKNLRDKPDLTFDELVPAIRREVGADLTFQECSWFSTYRIHHRCAERFRDRRCFLLGDAGHVHSPVGGQGMNTGLQDAYNLAWKLALVLKGQAGDSLLDTYEQERMMVAQNLLRSTDRAFTLLVSDAWFAPLFRTRIVANMVALAMRFARARELAFRTISQIGIRYPDSALSELVASSRRGPQPGDRFPWLKLELEPRGLPADLFERLDDTRFNLIVMGQPAPQAAMPEAGDALRVLAVADAAMNDKALAHAGIDTPAYFLLRPDGYIGLAGGQLAAADIARYFAARALFNKKGESNAMLYSLLRSNACVLVGFVFAVLASASSPARAAGGEAVYNATCGTCHDSGAGDAPRIAVTAEWKERFAAGRAALHAAAIAGVPNTAMAPKGGFVELSDAQIRAAVDYMLVKTGFVEPAQPRPVVRSAPAAAPAAGAPRPSDVVLTARVAAALKSALAKPTAPIEPQDSELIVRGIGIRVRALDGVVRLMGVVQDSSMAKRAESIAASLAGVRAVDNKLVSGGMFDFD